MRPWTAWGRPASTPSTVRAPLKRAIQQQVENPLSRALLGGDFAVHDTVAVDVVDDALAFSRKPATADAAG